MNKPCIAIVGFGNVGFHITKRLSAKGIPPQVISTRNPKKTKNLIAEIGCSALVTDEQDLSDLSPDFIILTVPDSAVSEVIRNFTFPQKAIVLHTSGSLPIDVFSDSERYGVLYPLQTFSLSKDIDFSEVPVLVEASDNPTLIRIKELASVLSEDIRETLSYNRLRIHLAAVVACNFSNVLYHQAEELLKGTGIILKDFQPLLEETVIKAVELGPKTAQTGPASRGDSMVVSKHLDALKENSDLYQLYKRFTEMINTSKSKE